MESMKDFENELQNSFRVLKIGEVLDVSESRISQLHTKANLRLRAKLTNLRKGII